MIEQFYPAPPWHWDQRAALWRYWVRDVVDALPDLARFRLMRSLPTDMVSAMGAWLGRRHGARAPVATQRMRELLRRLRPELTEAEVEALLLAHWQLAGRAVAEFAVQDRFLPEGRIVIERGDIPCGLVAAGRPLIVAGLHVGNWEVVHMGLSMLEIPFHAIFQALPNRFRMRIAYRMRDRGRRFGGAQASGQLLPTLAAPFQAHHFLESREAALLYYVDEDVAGRVYAPALGRALRMEGNIMRAVRLAQHAGAAIVPAYALRLGDAARFRLVFLPEVRLGPPGRGRAGILEDIAALDAVLEGVVRAHPEQWFMLHSFRAHR